MISVRFQGKSLNIMVIQACASTSDAEEAEVERFYEDRQDFLELTPQKDILFKQDKPKVKHPKTHINQINKY